MTAAKIVLPDLPYQPQDPVKYQPAIGLIGCGAITCDHLTAYKAAGYRVTALCDINQQAAIARQREYYPDAELFADYRQLLAEGDIEVVDVATQKTLAINAHRPVVDGANIYFASKGQVVAYISSHYV